MKNIGSNCTISDAALLILQLGEGDLYPKFLNAGEKAKENMEEYNEFMENLRPRIMNCVNVLDENRDTIMQTFDTVDLMRLSRSMDRISSIIEDVQSSNMNKGDFE